MFQGDAIPGDAPRLTNIFKQFVFWAVHIACVLVIWAGASLFAVGVCLLLYWIRMFAITGGYHRYFSHKTYQTSRIVQFILAFVGATSAQKGPIWWASHHRHHQRHSDTTEDIHSPIVSGVYYAHVGWVLSTQFIATRYDQVKDLLKFPELRLIDRFYLVPPIILAISLYYFGVWIETSFPQLETTAFQMLVWGFFISTVFLYHGTFCINSFCHLIGRKRFKTGDDSRNSLLLSLITLGEGWHNNHHVYHVSERQVFYWWEIDISQYIFRLI